MNKNFSTMKTNVGNNVQDTSSATATIIGNYINDAYNDFLRRANHDSFVRDYSFSTVAGTKDYVMPRDFGKEIYVIDSTNKLPLKRITLVEQAQDYSSTFLEQGAAERYMILKFPSDIAITSTVIKAFSSSASDTTQTVKITGLSAGVQISENLTLSGVSVQTTTNTFTSILSISKSASTTGIITVTDSGGSNKLAVMSPDDIDYRATIMRLNDIPSAVATINVSYRPIIEPLSDDNDFPLVDVADIIELGATARVWQYKRQFAKSADMKVLFEQAIVNYIWEQENQENLTRRFAYQPYDRDI